MWFSGGQGPRSARHAWPTAAAPDGRNTRCRGAGVPAAVPARDDAAVRTALTVSAVSTCRTRPVPAAVTVQTWMPSTPSSASTARTRDREGSRIGHIGSLFYLEAWSPPIQRGPDLSPSAPRRSGIKTHSHPRRQRPQPLSSAKGRNESSRGGVNKTVGSPLGGG